MKRQNGQYLIFVAFFLTGYTTIGIFFFGFLLLGAPRLWAQEWECAAVVTPEQNRFELEKFPSGWVYPELSAVAPSECLALTLHIVRRSNGTGGLTRAELAKAVSDLNARFQNVPMRFLQKGCVNHIDSDDFYYNSNTPAKVFALFQAYSVPNTINIFFAPHTGVCGRATFSTNLPAYQGILVDSACAGNAATLAHEMGHFFDLYHTHNDAGFGEECPDGSNCFDAGDRLCDTPADPNLRDHVDINCVYDNYATMPPGCGGIYAPQTDNLMSYSRAECRDLFTVQQKNKMLFTLLNSPNRINLERVHCDLISSCPADTTVGICPAETARIITYSTAAFDSCPGTSIACIPPPGSEFLVGSTPVICTANNASGFGDICRFIVNVTSDNTPPIVTCPADTTLFLSDVACSTSTVRYSASAVGNCTGAGVVCTPPSGSVFPVGVTTVTCATRDPTGEDLCNFSVVVPRRSKGDLDASADLTLADIVLMLNCVFLSTGDCDSCYTDVNCSGDLGPADVVTELNMVFLAPSLGC